MYKKLSYLSVILTLLLSLTSNVTADELPQTSKASLAMPAILSLLLADTQDSVDNSTSYKVYGITDYDPDYYDKEDSDYFKRYEVHDNYTLLGEFDDIDFKDFDVSQYSGFALFIYDKSYKIDLINLDYSNIYTTQDQVVIMGNIEIEYGEEFLDEFEEQDDGKVASPSEYVDSDNIAVLILTTYGKDT